MSTATAERKETISLILKRAKDGDISKALGIDDNREGELCELILQNVWDDNSRTTLQDHMATIAKGTQNHNELAWAMFVFGCHMVEKAPTPVASLKEALGLN